MKPISDKFYCDFMMSIGPHCRPALHMRYNNMRDFSTPLDWMMDYSIDTVLHLYKAHFEDFFIQIKEDKAKSGTAHGMKWVEDTKNHIISLHHFPENKPIEESKNEFLLKMKRRADDLDSLLKKSQRVVLVTAREESCGILCKFLESFSELYPNLGGIRLINMRHDDKMELDAYKRGVVLDNSYLSYVEYLLNDTRNGQIHPEGNSYVWGCILSEYETKRSREKTCNWRDFREENDSIVIYGAGVRCHRILNLFEHMGITVDGIAVSSMNNNPCEVKGVKVRAISEYSKDSTIIIGIEDIEETNIIMKALSQKGHKSIYYLDKNMDRIAFM